ncbi:MAG TPA: hypothetical protein VGA50_08515, partial [Kiloniellales bacterium]
GEEMDQVETRLLWKLGFNLPRYGTAISQLRRRLDEFNNCLLGISSVDTEDEREQVRRSGVNLFVSLEDFLERLVSFNVWLFSSDHFLDTRFQYNRWDVVAAVPNILGATVSSGEVIFAWNSGGENTIGTTQAYLHQFLKWLSQRQTIEKSTVLRSNDDLPHYYQDSNQVFPFYHVEAWADFDRTEFEVYFEKIQLIAKHLARSKLAGIRNKLDHKRPPEQFPAIDSMLAMVSRVREVVDIADLNRLIPKRFWLEDRKIDRYGRGTQILKDYAGRPYSLAIPMPVVSMPKIGFDAPVIISPGTFLADGAVPLILAVRSTSEYAKYWAGYPRRRQIPPPKEGFSSNGT